MGRLFCSPFLGRGNSPLLRCMKDFKTVAKTVEGNEGGKCHYNTRLDTYGCGCAHDCSYCYAKSLLEFRNLWNPQSPSVGDISEIAKAIRKLPREVVRLGGMTDCFQPAEKLHCVTYKTIKLLNKRKVPYLIVTKSALVAEYMDVLDKDLAHIQITVTTLDDKLCSTYEHASPPSKRIEAVQKPQEAGYDVQMRLSPYVPEFVDLRALNGLNIDKVCVEFLRVNSWIKKWFDIDYSEYTLHQGGYDHLPLKRKRELIEKITGFKEMTVCEDEDEAYQFWRDHFNHNPEDCCNLRRENKDATENRVLAT